ncbi:cardiolipin synthase [Aliidiomarina iranensis]|uniref:cardiolipin synthase n=1 Tax=Aliidiomarina iranensis TaxID=1434071 RepID=UPI0013008A98|nr:cardiolipin synthase [Aliidiomarina iranensis]
MQISDFLVIFYWLLIATVFLRIIFKRRPVSSSLAWVLIIVVFPFLGVIIYLLFGEIHLGKRRAERAEALRKPFLENLTKFLRAQETPEPPGHAARAIYQTMHKRDGIGGLSYKNFSVLADPDSIFDQWLADIQNAKRDIRMEFYIWHPHGRVKEITEALIAAAKRGVSIEILVDHAGSWAFFMFNDDLKRMRAAGVKLLPSLPVNLFRNFFRRVDLRLHRKLIVIDHTTCYTGSMNMADPRYFNARKKFGPWIDIMLRFEGAAAFGVSKVFSWDWELETGERNFPQLHTELEVSDQWLSIIPSGPGQGEAVMHQIMLSMIHRANTSITIATPYFVPSEAIFDALCHAAQRNVQVCILLPKISDSKIASFASESFYSGLLDAGVELRLFEKGLLHTKAMVVDSELAMVGSMNIDMRSLQLNFELSVALYNADSCKQVCQLLSTYKQQSSAIDVDAWHDRPGYRRMAERFMYFLSPLL